jgi:hypothetical protein
VLDLHRLGERLARLATKLDPDEVLEAQLLAKAVTSGLESGELEPSVASLQRLPWVA